MSDFSIITLAAGLLSIAGGLLYKFFPPKKHQWYYGIGLRSAKKSRETWEAAHRYAVKPLVGGGIFLLLLSMLPKYIDRWNALTGVTGAIVVFIIIIAGSMLTNRHLNRHFNEKGERRKKGGTGRQ